MSQVSPTSPRIGWVDHARALCIILVVMMHSTLGVGAALDGQGWLHPVVAFAEPFRIPAFFLVAGLFAHRVMGWQWRRLVDRRVLYYVYFYALWVTIQFALKMPGMVAEAGVAATAEAYLIAFVQPFGTLWFIYLLPLFFLALRLAGSLPALPLFAMALIAHVAPIETGWLVVDEFCERFVFFLTGHRLCRRIFAFADGVAGNPAPALALVALWVPLHALAADQIATPGVRTLLAFAGAAAIVTLATLLARFGSRSGAGAALAWIGRHTIVIYLAFFLPMAATRMLITKTGLVTDVGLAALITTLAALTGPIVLYRLVRRTGVGWFLFERPRWAIYERRAVDRAPVPAE